jgi:hypothetical protein
MSESWQLMWDGETLGVLTFEHTDQPFFLCHFRSTEAFSRVSLLFAAELQSLNAGAMDRWEQDYRKIESLGLRLVPADGSWPIDKFLLHIDGDKAWFRC